MQAVDFRNVVLMGGKAGKYANKRRKAKIHIIAGVRLDGQTCNGGSVTITVGHVEDMERSFGKLIADTSRELAALHGSVLKYCKGTGTIKLAGSIKDLLNRYEARHQQRSADLDHIIQYGALPSNEQAKDQELLKICIPQAGRWTTILLDGAQLYYKQLSSMQKGEALLAIGEDEEETEVASLFRSKSGHGGVKKCVLSDLGGPKGLVTLMPDEPCLKKSLKPR